MLTYLHKKAKTTFDWGKRPLFLRFNTDDQAEKRAAFVDLCALLKLDASEKIEFVDTEIQKLRNE